MVTCCVQVKWCVSTSHVTKHFAETSLIPKINCDRHCFSHIQCLSANQTISRSILTQLVARNTEYIVSDICLSAWIFNLQTLTPVLAWVTISKLYLYVYSRFPQTCLYCHGYFCLATFCVHSITCHAELLSLFQQAYVQLSVILVKQLKSVWFQQPFHKAGDIRVDEVNILRDDKTLNFTNMLSDDAPTFYVRWCHNTSISDLAFCTNYIYWNAKSEIGEHLIMDPIAPKRERH